MAENRNRTARRFSRRGNAPTAAAPAGNEFFVLPPRSSATHQESPRSSALSSTLVPASAPVGLPPLSPPAPPAPSATARSECSSPTSVGHALIRCQRALLHFWRALPQMNQDLAFRPSRSQRNPLMMQRKRQHTVFALCFAVHRDALAARTDLHFLHHFPHPHFLAGILPGHRIPAALPGHVRIPRHFAQLAIHVRIRGGAPPPAPNNTLPTHAPPPPPPATANGTAPHPSAPPLAHASFRVRAGSLHPRSTRATAHSDPSGCLARALASHTESSAVRTSPPIPLYLSSRQRTADTTAV